MTTSYTYDEGKTAIGCTEFLPLADLSVASGFLRAADGALLLRVELEYKTPPPASGAAADGGGSSSTTSGTSGGGTYPATLRDGVVSASSSDIAADLLSLLERPGSTSDLTLIAASATGAASGGAAVGGPRSSGGRHGTPAERTGLDDTSDQDGHDGTAVTAGDGGGDAGGGTAGPGGISSSPAAKAGGGGDDGCAADQQQGKADFQGAAATAGGAAAATSDSPTAGAAHGDGGRSGANDVSSGRRFDVHRAILAARCPYFATLFESGMADSSARELPLPDTDTDALKALLQFLYCGGLTVTSREQARSCLALADRLLLPKAAALLRAHLLSTVTEAAVASDIVWAAGAGGAAGVEMLTALVDFCAEAEADVPEDGLRQLAAAHPALMAQLYTAGRRAAKRART
ncbi:hypothetical protein HXX76_001300 [Chlamydomonas incerta]|uniref:BTB domain-containing protein n=1 Tax=Chlamydomonas incerta TaxID=51695 RepID=A0A835WC49_CHLIN|nr:hypothetical protein HXX76_001300 [Chlamydomonas incerta]|eukprot:KAG2444555.1 hypothetical protein HXX76_001300 [Chlamydomonas incerta]